MEDFRCIQNLNQEIKLEIPGIPLVWKAPYIGSRGAFSPRYKEKKIVQFILRDLYKGLVLNNLLIVDFEFYLPIPKNASKKKKILMLEGILRPSSGGDRINLAKFAEDYLQGIVIENDRQIVGGKVEKFYSIDPKTLIMIKSL